ncbi:aldose epimerase family protein [Echinicola vietnamensis]|uniref:Aldose 1-epimerase n=1 Tax=Echinicola vietnamensis (strain DSM 17526 / LMG 23754 / KMM 6221) TaxID=926556 RepID=L0FVJ4_ECHVK|nr:aldose epimerase family protein [Echinicola vietnamensis]AGA76786.1 galactose mutarotase-like enzyme [Echinicola vietnamensis DSM 17526]
MNLLKLNAIGAVVLAGALSFYACNPKSSEKSSEEAVAQPADTGLSISTATATVEGKEAQVYTLKNANGVEVDISNYGGVITRLVVPDKAGKLENVVLHYQDLEGYSTSTNYFGSTVGRYANRIAKGKFELDGEAYTLATNDGPNHLHGGDKGFNKVFWEAKTIESTDKVGLSLTYVSADGEEGYPGELTTIVTFGLDNDNNLSVDFEAVTDKSTIVNLTHHGYFNLSGLKETILGHELTLFADHYTPVDETLIPTGEVLAVEGTPFDFTTPHKIGERIDQVKGGYDHNYVVKAEADGKMTKMAELYHEASGRVMELYADSPAVQFYSGNFLDGSITVDGVTYDQYYGLCLEPQTFPNSPNEESFPSARLNPGETYKHSIKYHFDVK